MEQPQLQAPVGPGMDDLAREAESIGREPPPGGPEQGAAGDAQPKVTNATVIAGTLEAIREGFCFVTKLESPRRVFTADAATQLGAVWGAVCDKRKIDLQKWLGDWGLEFAALMATLQVVGAVREAVTAELAERKKAAEGAGAPVDEGQGAA